MYPRKLTKSNILDLLDERTIFEHYWPSKIDLRRNKYLSPFRSDNKTGSCHFNWWSGRFYFFDKAIGKCYDVFDYIMFRYACTFYEAMHKINIDFRLGLMVNEDMISSRIQQNIEPADPSSGYEPRNRTRRVNYKIYTRPFQLCDALYWKGYNLRSDTLKKFNVSALRAYDVNYTSDIWSKGYTFTNPSDPCYAYKQYIENQLFVKLYRPMTSKNDKWRTNWTIDCVAGYDQLPRNGKTLFITSSLKDGMCLDQIEYNFISPQSESSGLPSHIVRQLKERFQNIILLFDRDKTGVECSLKYSTLYDIDYRVLPYVRLEDNSKIDIAYISKMCGEKELGKIINKLI